MPAGTTAEVLRFLSWIDIQSLSLGGLIGAYLQWFRGTESFDERRAAVRNTLEGTESSNPPESFRVKQVNYVEQADSLRYRLQKFVPFLRSLDGRTKLTIQSTGHTSRSYVWASEENRPDFSSYLNGACSENYPPIEIVHPELDADSFTDIPELQLEIESVDVTEISKVIDQLSEFHNHYFDNYPGDGRFQLPY